MSNETFNPMVGVVAETNSGGLPAGNYKGVFETAEYLPAVEADPMTGEGGRKWAKVAFKWRIVDGDHKDKFAVRETPMAKSAKASYVQVCGLVMGKQLSAKDAINLTPFVGREYLLTIASKSDKAGNPTGWTHVSNAMLVPK